MTELDWKIAKAARRMRRRRENHKAIRFLTKAAAVILLAGAAAMVSGAAPSPEPSGKITVEHTVKSGETLWSIAEKYCGDTYIMQYMDTLKKNNPALIEHKGQIYPGQVIRLTYERE